MRTGARSSAHADHSHARRRPRRFRTRLPGCFDVKGCEACVNSHEQVVRDKGLNENHVTAAVRIAATIHAVATVLDAI